MATRSILSVVLATLTLSAQAFSPMWGFEGPSPYDMSLNYQYSDMPQDFMPQGFMMDQQMPQQQMPYGNNRWGGPQERMQGGYDDMMMPPMGMEGYEQQQYYHQQQQQRSPRFMNDNNMGAGTLLPDNWERRHGDIFGGNTASLWPEQNYWDVSTRRDYMNDR